MSASIIGDSDPFGALVDGARKLDMHVMARVDPHAIHQDAADAHPEWIAVDKDGNQRRHWAYPDVWVTCAYGDYNFKFMPRGRQGDRPRIRHRRDLRQSLAGPRRLLLRQLPDAASRAPPATICRATPDRRGSGLAGLDRLAPGAC